MTAIWSWRTRPGGRPTGRKVVPADQRWPRWSKAACGKAVAVDAAVMAQLLYNGNETQEWPATHRLGLTLRRQTERQRTEEHVPFRNVGHQNIGDLFDAIGKPREFEGLICKGRIERYEAKRRLARTFRNRLEIALGANGIDRRADGREKRREHDSPLSVQMGKLWRKRNNE